MTPLITPQQLVNIPDDVLVIDVQHDLQDPFAGLRAYAAGHLPQAAFLSVAQDLADDSHEGPEGGRHPLPNPHHFCDRLAELGAREDTLLVAYDASGGVYASRFWWLARYVGHLKVAVLDGGLQAWVAEGGQLQTSEFKKARSGRLTPRPTLCPRWNAEMIESWIQSGALPDIAVLLDARSSARFRGDEEPLDPVAGHIPGAINRPYSENLQPDGRFKAPSVLRAEFEALLNGQDPSAIVHSCGSGISACHNLVAMEAAGLHGSALYPGSWSEWCSNPKRPVATGPA
ncbi:MAG: hypothetical protein RL133_454 [Pseudomonadota bacterium]|jgi:thiosulfate/3-mercaptopyruvate sulfurtransferase